MERTCEFLQSPQGAWFGGVVTRTAYVSEAVIDGAVVEFARAAYNPILSDVPIAAMLAHNLFPPISFLFRRDVWARVGCNMGWRRHAISQHVCDVVEGRSTFSDSPGCLNVRILRFPTPRCMTTDIKCNVCATPLPRPGGIREFLFSDIVAPISQFGPSCQIKNCLLARYALNDGLSLGGLPVY